MTVPESHDESGEPEASPRESHRGCRDGRPRGARRGLGAGHRRPDRRTGPGAGPLRAVHGIPGLPHPPEGGVRQLPPPRRRAAGTGRRTGSGRPGRPAPGGAGCVRGRGRPSRRGCRTSPQRARGGSRLRRPGGHLPGRRAVRSQLPRGRDARERRHPRTADGDRRAAHGLCLGRACAAPGGGRRAGMTLRPQRR